MSALWPETADQLIPKLNDSYTEWERKIVLKINETTVFERYAEYESFVFANFESDMSMKKLTIRSDIYQWQCLFHNSLNLLK